MLAAYFITCVMNTSAVMNCSVSHTEMDSIAKTLADCNVAAAQLQDDAVQSVLIADLSLTVVRQFSGCASPAAAESVAVFEYNKLRSRGIDVELFRF